MGSRPSRARLRFTTLLVICCAPACGSSEPDARPPPAGLGGSGGVSVATGGNGGASPAAGGNGGVSVATGGSGGASPAAGGSGAAPVGGATGGAGGAVSTGGSPGTGGVAGTGGSAAGGSGGAGGTPLPRFSFFVTSLRALQELAKNQKGFGGDLRFGEQGEGAGLRGADKLCSTIAERSLPGASAKQWRAFLSATAGGPNGAVHAIERIGDGPWYDRRGRLVAMTKTDLQRMRPAGDSIIKDDLPNEDGIPNHAPDPVQGPVDNHQTLTGSNGQGRLYRTDPRYTCQDWASATPSDGTPRVGQSWLRMGFPASGTAEGYGSWLSSGQESGCGAGVNIVEMGAPDPNNPVVGSGGGYGGFYCFALVP